MRRAKRIGATLVVAKLDRLARDSAFLMKLYDGGVPIIFGDLPEVDGSAASRMIIHVMSSVAEFERRRIGERTSEALQALKAKGVKLGTPANLHHDDRLKGSRRSAANRVARALEDMTAVAQVAVEKRRRGMTLDWIAQHLNQEGYVIRQG